MAPDPWVRRCSTAADLALGASSDLLTNNGDITAITNSNAGAITLTSAQARAAGVNDGAGSAMSKVTGGSLIVTGVSVEGRKRRFTLQQLVDEPWILPPRGVPVRVRIDSAFLAAAGRTPADVIESASLLVNQQILDNERRFALMPDHAAGHYARRGLVARVNCTLPEIFGPLTLFTLQDAKPMPAALMLLEALRQVAPEAVAGDAAPQARD